MLSQAKRDVEQIREGLSAVVLHKLRDHTINIKRSNQKTPTHLPLGAELTNI